MSKFYYILTSLNPFNYSKNRYRPVKEWSHYRHSTRQAARNALKLEPTYDFSKIKIIQIDAVTFKPIKVVR